MQIEDILDEAIRYLDGDLDTEERQFFEALIEEFPHLQKELRQLALTRQGLLDLQETEKSGSSRTALHRVLWPFLVAALIGGLTLLLTWVSGYFHNKSIPATQAIATTAVPFFPTPIRQEQPADDQYLILTALGGDTDQLSADWGRAVCWTPDNDVAFACSFAGTGKLGNYNFASQGQKDILLGRYRPGTGYTWLLPFGGGHESWNTPAGIAVDKTDYTVVTGRFGDTLRFAPDLTFTAKGQDDHGSHDFFIARFAPTGQLQWLRHAGGHRIDHKQTGVNRGTAVTIDQQQHIVATGMYIGHPILNGYQLPTGGPNESAYLVKYTPQGDLQWVQVLTSNYMVFPFDVEVDREDNIYLTGSFAHHNYSGELYISRDTLGSSAKWDTLISHGGRDMFLAKYSPNGQLQWVRHAGSARDDQGHEGGYGLAIDAAGNCLVGGQFLEQAIFDSTTVLPGYGEKDIFLAKYDPDGQLLWVRQAGSPDGGRPGEESARGVAVTPSGDILVTGRFTGSARFDNQLIEGGSLYNFFLAKYTSDGSLLWVQPFDIDDLPDFRAAAGLSVAVNQDGQYVVTGFFSGSVRIGSRLLTSKGKEDIFILIFDENGKLLFKDSLV